MEANIPESLFQLYKGSHKNIDRALSMLLDSMDPECYQSAIGQMKVSSIETDNKIRINLGNSVSTQLQRTFPRREIDDELIITLLWVAVLFPEI